ncbi:DNA primase family protein [Singulisphaera sp. PoT]|uniref:DNA primase family protein n=1 Tax=Singulisphaera sp. PoT TaxID=3411797 RepID=UPI003BF5D58A
MRKQRSSFTNTEAQALNEINFTDAGNAERLVRDYGDIIRYDRTRSTWHSYNAKRGVWVEGPVAIEALAKKTIKAWLHQSIDEDDSMTKRTVDWAMRSLATNSLKAMVTQARLEDEIEVQTHEFDADDWLLNCLNGTVDLRTGELRPHRPEDLLTMQAPVRYNPDAKCPRFDKFEEEIFLGDREAIDYLNRVLGHALTGDPVEQKLYVLDGDGRNGKNVIADLMLKLLGPYACQADHNLLLSRNNPDHPANIADLKGRRLVIANETDKGKRFAESLMKSLTGNDFVKGRDMYEKWGTFRRTFTVFLVTNHLPDVSGNDDAIWRRIERFELKAKFLDLCNFTDGPKAELQFEREYGLTNRLFREEAEGILALLVRSCLEWSPQAKAPASVDLSTQDYKAKADHLERFVAERGQVGPEYTSMAKPLHDAYVSWCKVAKPPVNKPMDTNDFKEELEKKYVQKRSNRGQKWFGIGLATVHATNHEELGRTG